MKRKIIILFVLMHCLIIASFAQTSVPNGDFENWTDSINAPSWSTNNYNVGGFIYYSFVHQSTDANGGNFAAKIETRNIPVLGDMTGLMTLGSYDMLSGISGGIPIVGKPAKLLGYLKYEPVAGDTMAVIVVMTKWNGSTRDTLFYDGVMANNSIPAYTVFEIPISYAPPTASPDTVNILAVSSAGYAPQIGSTLYIDDLSLEYITGMADSPGTPVLSLFPNPTSGLLSVMLDGNNNNVRVYNIVGEEILNQQTSLKNLNIDLTVFPAGVYMLEVSSGYVKYYKKIIVSR